MPEKIADKAANSGRDNPFLQFLTALEAVPKQITDAMIRQTTDEDHKSAVGAYGDALRRQVHGLSSYMREGWPRLSPQAQAEVSRVVTMSGSSALFSGINSLSKSMNSPTAKISISGIIQELKKLIKLLISLFGSIPQWLDTLLALIDEILNSLLSVGLPGLASTLSRMHQDFLHEQILLARLNREQAAQDRTENNDSNLHRTSE
jgi:hypothetical protein